jgi:hypothetical protein
VINVRKYINGLSIASLCLALAGCGGGGSAVNSTPPPAAPAPSPVTPANLSPSTSFSNSMQSGNFVTIRASGSTTVKYSTDGNTRTTVVTVSPADTTNYISYDAASNVYAVNFTNSSGQAAKSAFDSKGLPVSVQANGIPDPTEIQYDNTVCFHSGCSGGINRVTHTGSGSFKYSYTAVAYFNTSQSDNFAGSTTLYNDFSVFGFPTPAAAVPRTGSATYALDLMGRYPGTGTGSVNFGSGTYNFSGTIAQSIGSSQTTGTFQSTGTLASASNGFSGTVNLAVNTTFPNPPGADVKSAYTFSGPIGGMFFGPTAQELGGTFVASTTSSSTTAGSVLVPDPVYGAILGHR